jgi:hypothetical protein
LLKAYDELEPGRAAKLLILAEDQARHRMTLETTHLRSDRRRSWAGLGAGFAVAMTALGCGTWLIFLGHDLSGGAVVGVDLLGLVSTFIYGTQSQRTERIEKTRLMTGRK